MSENISDPFGTLKILRDLSTAQQKFLPAGEFFEHIGEAARIVSAAQVEYGQALMRANSLLFGAFLQPSAAGTTEIRPSVAAKQMSTG
jgi:hypothetical protein